MNLLPGEFHLLTNVPWNTTNLGLVPWSTPDFNIMSVEDESPSIKLYPNPARDFVKVDWDSPVAGETTLKLVDAMGRELYQKNVTQTKGLNSTAISVEPMSKGIYFIQINKQRAKLLIQ
jgi:hypothetical protein